LIMADLIEVGLLREILTNEAASMPPSKTPLSMARFPIFAQWKHN
jgi:hypothetical protein